MYNATVDAMRHQLSLIEQTLNRKLTDDDELKEIQAGLFYLNPDEIVKIVNNEAKQVSYFTLSPETQHDIWLNYSKE